ncbi:LLM class flavin-dependent oxidoreductase [Parahaliea aestuarii]|uniref:LLM class flavin-dependent oxidoreductase n=1 Tax=Parahaliea aestuarii TaxID=1852021 RepID=A0A5C9A0H0_9GAMM|nr:LLM class flavin-dependent oxidoreductase [Parahaliea aestuarii]TXS93382.1 LLM class flavin-dependent oxidoreductase [Parahaliea aestuarii]
MKLSVLDQSLARSADAPEQALQESLEMARYCEALGYGRFWVSEHHAFPSVAGSAPEVLLAALGAATSKIRLGSGGIMLPHYSAYKIAEVFSLLANLYPGRIDLGVGRAPGADMSTAVALATDGRPKFERFPQLVEALSDYLWNPAAKPLVSPRPPPGLPLWMLGSSPDSAVLAARRGLPYNLGLFINPQAAAELVHLYKAHFTPSELQHEPYAIVTTSVFCADDEVRAKALQLTFDLNFYRFVTGQSDGQSLTPEQALAWPIGPREEAFIASRNRNRAVGTPAQVRSQLLALADRYAADEIMVVSNMYYLEDRKRCFELLRSQFD